jgi:septum formation topological specificity factor MinE
MSSRGSDICWRDQISVQISADIFADICRYLQISADIFADICKYLHISADICKYLQISADVCRYLHKASRYNIIEAQLTMQSISYYTDSSLCPHLALPHCHHCCTIVHSPCPSTSIQPFATIPLLSG